MMLRRKCGASRKTAMGQTQKNSVRAYVFRFALELGHCSKQLRFAFVPKSDINRFA